MEHTEEIAIRTVTSANWRETLELAVRPEQQRFISEYTPIAALALAKAYIRPGGMIWTPYAIYAGAMMVGFFTLAHESDTTNQYWLFHFFIDQRYQGRGYGRAAMQRIIELVRREQPQSQMLQLTVHPDNLAAQRLYIAAGFQPTGGERWGEPVYRLSFDPAADAKGARH
ncbi:MAG TPA: GNAT family N-acetyltransferase [Ktedonobacterales bacterium]|nr:GNAT family N-acetyltransferase [Ktedonobacterales bacterium]